MFMPHLMKLIQLVTNWYIYIYILILLIKFNCDIPVVLILICMFIGITYELLELLYHARNVQLNMDVIYHSDMYISCCTF